MCSKFNVDTFSGCPVGAQSQISQSRAGSPLEKEYQSKAVYKLMLLQIIQVIHSLPLSAIHYKQHFLQRKQSI